MEKTFSFLLVIVVVLSFMFDSAINNNLVVADSEPSAVRDINNKKVRTGVEYYILPVARGLGGGLTLGDNINSTTSSCPLQVVQEHLEISDGFPLTFTPTNPKKGIIRVSTDLNIVFSAASICVQTTLWTLSDYDESTKQWFVSTGGVQGNPGRETISNWFKIREFDDDYKLVYCPTVCDFCKPICSDIGIFIDSNRVRRLALSDVPFKIMIKKA